MSAFLCVLVSLFLVSSNGQVSVFPGSGYLAVDEGQAAEFSCSGSGPHLLQYNSNVTAINRLTETYTEESSGDDSVTVSYSLASTVRADNGTTVQCFFDGYGSDVLTILVDFPPRYSPDQVTYIVIEGSSPLLTLALSAFPEVTQYTWTKEGVSIQTTPTRTLSPDGIFFSSVSRDDSGTYTVQTSNGGGVATIDLVVYYAPVFNEGSGLVNRSVSVGQDVTLSCGVMAMPTISELTLSHSGVEDTANVAMTTDSFTITGVVVGNTGLYICRAENDVGVRELTFTVTVNDSPSPSSTVPSATGSTAISPSSSPDNGSSASIGSTVLVCVLLFVATLMMTDLQ